MPLLSNRRNYEACFKIKLDKDAKETNNSAAAKHDMVMKNLSMTGRKVSITVTCYR